jgi:hypothetical protein
MIGGFSYEVSISKPFILRKTKNALLFFPYTVEILPIAFSSKHLAFHYQVYLIS